MRFLQRWSQRKIACGNRTEAAKASPPAAREMAEADFADVDFDALGFDSDYTRFLLPGVPPSIRNRALRKLWTSSAVLSEADGLMDYAGDFTDAALAVRGGVLESAYRIGRGFMTDEDAEAWAKLGASEEVASSKPVCEEVRGEARNDGLRRSSD